MAAYTQCLRCAGAPRRPAGGSGLSLPFLLGMPLSMTPGSSIIARPELRCRHGLRRDLSSSALPILPQSVSRGARISGLPDSRICYGLPSCSPPLYGSDRYTRPPRAFTSRLPTDRSPSPLLDMTTTATGLLCWRDSHPLKWQLASLHQIVPWSTLCRAIIQPTMRLSLSHLWRSIHRTRTARLSALFLWRRFGRLRLRGSQVENLRSCSLVTYARALL